MEGVISYYKEATNSFDNQGNLLTTTYADGYSTTNWYNALGQVIVTGDAIGYRWFWYNNQGLLTVVSNAFGAEKTITYDIEDQPWYVTDANGVTVTKSVSEKSPGQYFR